VKFCFIVRNWSKSQLAGERSSFLTSMRRGACERGRGRGGRVGKEGIAGSSITWSAEEDRRSKGIGGGGACSWCGM
jgi:hypothetical protein